MFEVGGGDEYADMDLSPDPSRASGSSELVKELASLSLNIQSKKFYLDIKENQSGRFLKVAEINVSGIKNKIIFDIASAKVLLEHLIAFAAFYVSMGPQTHAVRGYGSTPLKSESFKRLAFDRIYHIDLAENEKGIFLKLSCANQGGVRAKQAVVIPAQGIVEFRDKLKKLLDDYYVEEVEMQLPPPRKMAYDNRLLFMDVGFNNKGFYLKMSEIHKHPHTNYRRQTIQIPRRLWLQIRDNLDQLYEETAGGSAAGGAGPGFGGLGEAAEGAAGSAPEAAAVVAQTVAIPDAAQAGGIDLPPPTAGVPLESLDDGDGDGGGTAVSTDAQEAGSS